MNPLEESDIIVASSLDPLRKFRVKSSFFLIVRSGSLSLLEWRVNLESLNESLVDCLERIVSSKRNDNSSNRILL